MRKLTAEDTGPDTPLKLFRKINHLSQIEASRLVKCRQSTWNRIERGQAVSPRKDLIDRIMAMTDLPIESILVAFQPIKRINRLGRQPHPGAGRKARVA